MKENDTIHMLCECDSSDCNLKVEISVKEAHEIIKRNNLILIVDGCQIGPEPTDELKEKRKGYALYSEN